jgi:hypothetical protein
MQKFGFSLDQKEKSVVTQIIALEQTITNLQEQFCSCAIVKLVGKIDP